MTLALIADHSNHNVHLSGPIMRLEKVQNSDAGSYSCHASNGIGDELVAHFSISVKGT